MAEHVTLISPSGARYVTDNPVEINNLVYGEGYRRAPAPEPDTADPAPRRAPRPTVTRVGLDKPAAEDASDTE